jgi:hypothetical protein
MSSTSLVIAVVFAGIFGTALVWLAIYCIHRYIHMSCLKLDHWFHVHVLIPPGWRSPCRHCEGTGRKVKTREKSRSSSSRRRRNRSASRGRRCTSRHDGRGQRMIDADTEWHGIGREQEHVQVQRPTLPSSQSMQDQQYDPWQGQISGAPQMYPAYQQSMMYPQAYPHTYRQTFQQPWHPNATMPDPAHQQTIHIPIHIPPTSAYSTPVYPKVPRRAYTERSKSQTSPKAAPKERSRVHRDDFLHIVDDYPPIIKNSLKKTATTQISSSSSSSSSTSTDSAEEIPRGKIPRAAPRFTKPEPSRFAPHPHMTTQPWATQTPHPQQWEGTAGGGGANDQPRYASPFTRPTGWTSWRHVPSNTPFR